MTVGELKAALAPLSDDMGLFSRIDNEDAYFLDIHTEQAIFGNGFPVSPVIVAILSVSKGVPISKKVA